MSGLKSILKPILTEKAASLQDDGVYVFQVTSKSDKSFIKKSIEENLNFKISRHALNFYGECVDKNLCVKNKK